MINELSSNQKSVFKINAILNQINIKSKYVAFDLAASSIISLRTNLI